MGMRQENLAAGDIYISGHGFLVKHPSESRGPVVALGLGEICTIMLVTSQQETATTLRTHLCLGAFMLDEHPSHPGKVYIHHTAQAGTYVHDKRPGRKDSWTGGKSVRSGISRDSRKAPATQYDVTVAQTLLNCVNVLRTSCTYDQAATMKVYSVGAPDSSGQYMTDDEIIKVARGELFKFAQECNSARALNAGEVQAEAFDSLMRFDGNMLALFGDLRNIGKSTASGLLDLMHGVKNPRRLARAWLSARYGDKLTYQDLKSLFEGFTRDHWRRSRVTQYLFGRSRRTVSALHYDGKQFSVRLNCQIALQPKDYNLLMKQVRSAYEWDYYPSLANMWDLVPLSFVVDWFVDVSSIFEDLDRMVQARYYSVVCAINTVKASTGSNTLKGVELSYYDREPVRNLSLGMSSVNLGLPSAINIVDGISLFLM
jgi:hypothetical protein